MIRSPEKEEEDGEGAGAGRRGRPRHAVGEEVEVLFKGDGFRGARFKATVARRRPRSGSYEVVYSTLDDPRDGGPLREVVAAADVRPPAPPPPPGREIEMFDLVEAYTKGGWWPGVVSGVLRKRYAVSLPLFREVLNLRPSLVRPRREFVCGRWMDAQDVLRGIPLYAVGSSVEVLCIGNKEGTAWKPATIIKMVGGVNYVVSYGDSEGSIDVVHSCFIRPQPVFDRTKFEYGLEPSTEVEIYQDGIWLVGIIEDVCIGEPRKYKIRVKHHGKADDDFLVSSTSLRPYSKGDGQEWKSCSTKKHAKKGNDSVAEYSSEFSTSGGDSDRYSSEYKPGFSTCAKFSDQYSSDCSPEFFTSDRDIDPYSYVPNKRVRKDDVVKEEVPLTCSLNLRQYTAKSSPKEVMDLETIPEKEATGVKQLESGSKCLGFRVAKGKDQVLAANVPQKLINTQCDGKGRHFLPKARASKRKEHHYVPPLDDIVKAGSKSKDFDVVVISDDSGNRNFIEISDDSGNRNFIEISDTSSSNPNRKRRRMNLPDKELHSNRSVHRYQASPSSSNMLSAKNHRHDLSLEMTRYSEEQAGSRISSDTLFPLESSQDPSHNDGGLLRISETKESELSDNLHLQTAMMSLVDSASGDEPHEMCQNIAEVKSWMAGASKGANISLINSINCITNQKTDNQSCGGASPIGKLETCSSVQKDANVDILCIEAPNDNKMEIITEVSVMPPKEEAAVTNTKLKPSSSGQQDVNLLCIEAPNDNKMQIKNERTDIYEREDAALPIGKQDAMDDLLCIQAPKEIEIQNEGVGMSFEAAEGLLLETCMNSAKMIADESHPQHNVSSQNSFGQLQVSISGKSSGPSSFVHPGMTVDVSTFMPLPVPSSSNLAPAFSTSSLLLMPVPKMEIFERLPQIPHFREVWNCPAEFREGKALGLIVSFANMADSIKKMQIQAEARLYQEKMNSLLDLEENGFQVGPLKVRLNNLLCTRNRHINLKNRKASLEKEMLEIEATNCRLEQEVKFLDMCIMGMEEKKYQKMKAFLDMQKAGNCLSISKLQVDLRQVEESLAKYQKMKAFLDMQKAGNCLSISKLQVDLRQVEESLVSVESDFCSIASAPWESDVGSSIP